MNFIEYIAETVFWRMWEVMSRVQVWLRQTWGKPRPMTFSSLVHASACSTDQAMLVSHSTPQEQFLVPPLFLLICVASSTSQTQWVIAVRELHMSPTTVYHHICLWLTASSEAICIGGFHAALPDTFLSGEITVILGPGQDEDGELLQSVQT